MTIQQLTNFLLTPEKISQYEEESFINEQKIEFADAKRNPARIASSLD